MRHKLHKYIETMKTVQTELNLISSYPMQIPYAWEDILFFDIETTGFSAHTSFLYLIGCMYFKNGKWHMTQWLSDEWNGEKEILTAFLTMLTSYKRLVHYNGSGFDIPFILQKCRQHNIPYAFDGIESFDIYKKLRPYKRVLPLSDFKLKTVESFLNLERKDTYSGEELIHVYANYLGRLQYEKLNRSQSAPASDELSEILLLHNMEDVKNLLKLSGLLYYTDIFGENPETYEIFSDFCDEYVRQITFRLPCILPRKISWEAPLAGDCLRISAADDEILLRIPIYKGELKYFYANYKDYYYLPKEDMAVHKSVAQFVDRDYREKAKASNCYRKQAGCFLPQPEELAGPSFKSEYNDKVSFLDITNPFLKDAAGISRYIQSLIRYVLSDNDTKIN